MGKNKEKFGRGKSFDFKRKDDDSRNYGKKRFSNNNERSSGREFPGRGQSYEVICAKCAKHTDVPFRPTNNKPVYCRDCFDRNESSGFSETRGRERSLSSTSSGVSSKELAAIHEKLDRIIQMLEELEVQEIEDERDL